jgi:hypothetical protein
MFKAVYVNIEECYGPEGSWPLAKALEDLTGSEDVNVHRGDGFALVLCPVKGDWLYADDGSVVARNSKGEVIVIEPATTS